jgi:hypothetical protein
VTIVSYVLVLVVHDVGMCEEVVEYPEVIVLIFHLRHYLFLFLTDDFLAVVQVRQRLHPLRRLFVSVVYKFVNIWCHATDLCSKAVQNANVISLELMLPVLNFFPN